MIVRGEAKRMSTPEEKPERASIKKVIVIRASPRVGGNSDQLMREYKYGSRNREKERIRIVVVTTKVANQRRNFAFKVARSIVNRAPTSRVIVHISES